MSASGWTYRETFVLFDYETESMWYHFERTEGLTCIGGFYKDRFLPELKAKRIRWNAWVQEKPTTKFMACKEISQLGCAGY